VFATRRKLALEDVVKFRVFNVLASEIVMPNAPRQWMLQHPVVVLMLVFAFLALISPLLGRLWITIDYKVYFDDSDPQLQAMEALEDTFIDDNTLFVMMAPDTGNVFQPRVLALIDRLTEASWQIPYSLRVDSIANYQFSRAEEDILEVFPLFGNPESLSAEQIERRKQEALNDPAIAGTLVSRDGRVAAVAMKLNIPDNPVEEVPEVAEAIRSILSDLKADYPDIRFYLNGSIMADQSFADAIERDGQFLTPLSYLLIFALIAILLRSAWAMGVALLVIVASVLTALAGKVLFNPAISTATVIAPSVIMIVSVADCVHLFSTLFQRMREGADKLSAMQDSLALNFKPILLTSLTTAVGFLGLNFSESPPLRDMGNTVAIGTIAAMIFSLVLVPALVRLLPIKMPGKAIGFETTMGRLSDLVVHQPRNVLIAVGALTLVLLAGLPRNEINEVFVEYFDQSFDFRQANEFMDENLRGVHRLNFKLDSGEADGIFDPGYLGQIESFTEYLKAQPGITDVESYVQVIKRLNSNMHNDETAYYRLPDSREEAAQFTLLYELSLPFGQDLTHLVSIDRSATRVTAALRLTGSEQILATKSGAEQWLRDNAPDLASPGVSIDTMFSQIARDNVPAMLEGTFYALVVISLLILVATRSASIGAISLIPNLLPMAMAFGFWGYWQGRIGLTDSVIASLTMGLIVDDTVHFLTKYLRARREQMMTAREAVRYTLRTVGGAIVITSIVFAVGFSVLAFSPFAGNSHLGFLTAITIAFALLADLLLLPAFLIMLDDWRSRRAAAADVGRR